MRAIVNTLFIIAFACFVTGGVIQMRQEHLKIGCYAFGCETCEHTKILGYDIKNDPVYKAGNTLQFISFLVVIALFLPFLLCNPVLLILFVSLCAFLTARAAARASVQYLIKKDD